MKHGVILDKGPADWQVLQQREGKTDIHLSGRWYPFENIPAVPEQMDLEDPSLEFMVFVRIVMEDSGEVVINWTKSNTQKPDIWEAVLRDVPTGGLYRIETCLDNNRNGHIEWAMRGDMVHHIGVGDLYIIAGQSNSAGYGRGPVYDPPMPGVHIFKNSGKWDMASNPLNESTGTLYLNRMENANPGVSPYLSFGRQIFIRTGMPIGLIQTSKGGSSLAEWDTYENGHLYRSMLETVRSTTETVRGVLWHQGCSDTSENASKTYLSRFARFVKTLRKDLGEEIVFLTCQLNRHMTFDTDPAADRSWGILRNAQRLAAKEISGVYVVPTMDCGLSDIIHNDPSANILIGERLAALAIKYIYGKTAFPDAPDINYAQRISDTRILMNFNNVSFYIVDFDTPVKNLLFSVEDDAGPVEIIGYVTRENTIELELSRPLEGHGSIHHAMKRNFGVQPFEDSTTHLPILGFCDVRVSG